MYTVQTHFPAMAKQEISNEDSAAISNTQSLTIIVEGGRRLVLTAEELSFEDPAWRKNNRSCFGAWTGMGTSPNSHTIPLYNVLWAEITSSNNISIDCVDAATHKVVNWTFGLPPVATPPSSPFSPTRSISFSLDTSPDIFATTLLARAYPTGVTRRRRCRVIINPKSGPGVAELKWNQDAQPIFAASRALLKVSVTTRQGEGASIAETIDPDEFDCIVVCSGDGLVHEVFNGLARRPDAKKALKAMPVAHLPCGSGNALSCNVNGTCQAAAAALAIVKGVVTAIDLASVTHTPDPASPPTAQPPRMISFLSQSLGLLAETDLGTEDLRWMGETRFTYGFLQRIFTKKVYPCDIAVKLEVDTKAAVRDHYRRYRTQGPAPISDEYNGDDSLPALKYGTVQDQVPSDWTQTKHDTMGTLYCGNTPFVASKFKFFPAACPRDGTFDMMRLDNNASIPGSINLMMEAETGAHFDNDLVTYQKVSAYRVTPRNQSDGYMSIDGERIPFGPFQVEVHQGLGRVISKRGFYEAHGPKGWNS